jgi:MYXO-CTERM domain-containing protein
MKRLLVLTALGVMLPVGAAHAQTDPTVPVPVTSVVERDVTVNSIDNRELDDDDDDDSDKTGLWGLLGLLGLAGLAGLKRKRDDTTYTTGTVRGDTTPRGSTGTGTGH